MQHPPPTSPGEISQPYARRDRAETPREPADRGTHTSRVVAVVSAIVLYLVLAVSQNTAPYLIDKDAQLGREPQGGEIAKLLLLVEHGLREIGGSATSPMGGMAAGQYASSDLHPADRLQAVLILGEASGPDDALRWLEAIRMDMDLGALAQSMSRGSDWQTVVAGARGTAGAPPEAWAMVKVSEGEQPDREALADAEVMERLYSQGAGSLSGAQADRLVDRYGWLGELALAQGEEPDAPVRSELFANAGWAVLMIVVVLAVLAAGFVGGLVAFVLALVMLGTGRLRRTFVPPQPGGSVYLETFALFLALFLAIHLAGDIAGQMAKKGTIQMSEQALTMGVLIAQWLMLPVLLWPILRGVPGREWRAAVGWRAPRGVWREIGAGILGYFAGLPLFFLGIGVTFGLNVLAERLFGGSPAPPSNPIFELVTSGGALVILLVALLATVWAPIMEETLFRGGLYRHMRGRTGVVLAGIATAFLFAYLHSYGPLMTGPLIALGFTFAMIREWRGSLIGPMTAHCLHNSTVMAISLLMLLALR